MKNGHNSKFDILKFHYVFFGVFYIMTSLKELKAAGSIEMFQNILLIFQRMNTHGLFFY